MSAIVSTQNDETRLAPPIGKVAAVSLDGAHRFSKLPVEVIRLGAGYGVEGNVARHGKLPPQRHEELPPPRIAEERANEAGTNH